MLGGPLALVNIHSGKALQGAEGNGEKAAVAQSVDHGEKHQRWLLIPVADGHTTTDYYKIMNLASGLFLGIEHGSSDDGAAVCQQTYPNGHEVFHMQWQLQSAHDDKHETFYCILNRNSQKCLDVTGGGTEGFKQEEACIIQWSYWAGRNQRWRLIPSPVDGHIKTSNRSAPEVSAALKVDRAKALSFMRPIFGWFSEKEAELLLATAERALHDLPTHCTVVEIGSYLGRSTALLASAIRDLRPWGKLIAIDPHTGTVSVAGDREEQGVPTYEAFCANMTAAGLGDAVHTLRQRSTEVVWDQPIGLLFIDGLHDYHSVSTDFHHFERNITPSGFVAFHDHASSWPGVTQLVDEIQNRNDYERIDRVDSLIVLQKQRTSG